MPKPHTADILIRQAADVIGCTATWDPPMDPMDVRQVAVLRGDGSFVTVQVHAKATYTQIVDMLSDAYGTAEDDGA